jgi:hypothetical protein
MGYAPAGGRLQVPDSTSLIGLLKSGSNDQASLSNEQRQRSLMISPFGVRCVWQRHDRENMKKRLKALEAKLAQDGCGKLHDQTVHPVRHPPRRE